METNGRVDEFGHHGTPSTWPCPDCHGVLRETDSSDLRFRCRVGHVWAADDLRRAQAREAEAALWTAVRSLEDRAAFDLRLADRASQAGHELSAQRFRSDADDLADTIARLRRFLASGDAIDLGHEDRP